jgi:hypothetical protein
LLHLKQLISRLFLVVLLLNQSEYKCFHIFAAVLGLVAQWIEQQPSKLRAIGSNPIGVTSIILCQNPLPGGFFSTQVTTVFSSILFQFNIIPCGKPPGIIFVAFTLIKWKKIIKKRYFQSLG